MNAAYCVPASPSDPTTPVDNYGVEVRRIAQKVDIWDYVTHQIDALHSCLDYEKDCKALACSSPA